MVFVSEKIKRTNKFSLDGLSAKRAVKPRTGLSILAKCSISILTGGLLALSGPGFDQWWLAWLMVAPFLVLLNFCHKNIEAILSGLCFGLGYNLVGLHYYVALSLSNQENHLGWQIPAAVWILQALTLSLPTAVFAWLICSLPLRPGYAPYFKRPFFSYLLTVPLLWIFLHWGLTIARPLAKVWQFIPLPPVMIDPLVYSQYCLLDMLQVVRYMGPAGLEFILLLFNAAIAALILEMARTQERPVERVDLLSPRFGATVDLFVAILTVGVIYGFGQNQIYEQMHYLKDVSCGLDAKTEIGQPVLSVGIVAGRLALPSESTSTAKELALVVFPEKTNEINESSDILKAMKNSARREKNLLLVNLLSSEKNGLIRNNLMFSPANSLSTKQNIFYSKQIFLEDDASIVNDDDLLKVLPEPMKEWLFALNKEDPSSWYSLPLPKVSWGRLGLLGGSDISDSRLVANEVRRGASLLISSTDLSWTHSKFLNKQILAAAVFRAIENNRYIVLSTNNGVLSIIEPSGIIQSLSFAHQRQKQLGKEDQAILLGAVQFRWSKTPFTKMWWL